MNILHIEDNPGDARLVVEMLKESGVAYTLKTAGELKAGLDLLASENYDIVLLDLNLPDSMGLDTLFKIQSQSPGVPVVVKTSVGDELLAKQAVQHGAQDFLIKGQVSSQVLWRSLVYAIERKRMEQALRESQNELATILSSAPVAIIVVDKERRILEANSAAMKLAGRQYNELIGMKAGDALNCLNSSEDARGCGFGAACENCKTRITLQDTLATGKSHFQVEWHIPVKTNGETKNIHILLSTVPLVMPTKQVLVCIEDITKLKDMEEQLISYERLATIGKVSGSIAHEIRNPLAVIESSIFYLNRVLQPQEERVKTHLGRMTSATHRCTTVIEALLKLTHPEELRQARVDWKRLVNRVITENCSPEIRTICEFKPGNMFVLGDEEQLNIALRNIVFNAVQAMNEKGTLTVRIRERSNNIETDFEDTGTGILPENLNKIFEPLFTTKARGVGLGLSISKSIIEMHNGTINVVSEPGKGAIFTVSLPLSSNRT